MIAPSRRAVIDSDYRSIVQLYLVVGMAASNRIRRFPKHVGFFDVWVQEKMWR